MAACEPSKLNVGVRISLAAPMDSVEIADLIDELVSNVEAFPRIFLVEKDAERARTISSLLKAKHKLIVLSEHKPPPSLLYSIVYMIVMEQPIAVIIVAKDREQALKFLPRPVLNEMYAVPCLEETNESS